MINAINFNLNPKAISFAKTTDTSEKSPSEKTENLEKQPIIDIFENSKNSKPLTQEDIDRIEKMAVQDEFKKNPDDAHLAICLLNGVVKPEQLTEEQLKSVEPYMPWNMD